MSQLFEPDVSSWQVDLEHATAKHPSGLTVQFQPISSGMGAYVGIPLNLEEIAASLLDSVEDDSELRDMLMEMLNAACEAYQHQLNRRH